MTGEAIIKQEGGCSRRLTDERTKKLCVCVFDCVLMCVDYYYIVLNSRFLNTKGKRVNRAVCNPHHLRYITGANEFVALL